ncbi:hypothetical protein LOD99_12309 [Oopsacas minuta]|uniref:Uncharacterized protein n=1 Tax=Oopsacas minuta TaxID=111878 RepID=A0AAV7JEV0_9METZ|nr:hypothetical protein LOD99_12309 [Oopsacas minuta]
MRSSTSHTKHSDTGGSSQPVLARPWSRPTSSKNSNREDISFFTVSVRYGGSEISASNFSEMLPNKMAMMRAAASGKQESSSFVSLSTKSRKSSNASHSVPSMA